MIFTKDKCSHNKIYPFSDGLFCPDCGEEIKISWQILRCKCCSSKRKAYPLKSKLLPLRVLTAIIRGIPPIMCSNILIPEEKFCKKCGSYEYYIDTREKIEFFDYEYAIILKEEVKTGSETRKTTQVWIEEENIREVFGKQRLLPVF